MTTTETSPYNYRADADLNDAQRHIMMQIDMAADNLHRAVAKVRKTADEALAAMTKGYMVDDFTGVFGHAATDAEKYRARVGALIEVATVLGIEAEKVQAVYTR